MTGLVLLTIYTVYISVITISLMRILNMLKKAYKSLIYVTLGAVIVTIVILYANGQVQNNFERPVLSVAGNALFNCYVFLVSYLYSPCTKTP